MSNSVGRTWTKGFKPNICFPATERRLLHRRERAFVAQTLLVPPTTSMGFSLCARCYAPGAPCHPFEEC